MIPKRTNLLICAVLAALALSFGCSRIPIVREAVLMEERENTRIAEEAIQNNPVYQEIDRVCAGVPKPQDAVPVFKRKSWNEKRYLTYAYHSKVPYSQMKEFYLRHFEQEKWECEGEEFGLKSEGLDFRKDGYSVSVTYFDHGDEVNYVFGCEKLQ